ncbi:regulatory protein Sir3p [Monosporozyma unispora]|nr:chromatin-silencing protein sir3 [Kazachstania unispora]
MATSQKDLEGWQVVTTDENGKIIQDSGRRSRKKIPVENVYIQRTSDGLSFGRGDSVVMHDDVTGVFSVYLVHEIRQNTLNNLIEIWAFSYLRSFELNAKKYYSQFKPEMLHKGIPKDLLARTLFNEIDPYELYLTAELSEIWLKDFKYVAQVYTKEKYEETTRDRSEEDPKDFYVRYICEPTAESFVKVDINKEVEKIKLMESKTSEERLKQMTVPMQRNSNKKLSALSTTSSNRKPHQLKERRVSLDSDDEESSSPHSFSPMASNIVSSQNQKESTLFHEEIESDSNTPMLSESQNPGRGDYAAPSSDSNDADAFTSADDGNLPTADKGGYSSYCEDDNDDFVADDDAPLAHDGSPSGLSDFDSDSEVYVDNGDDNNDDYDDDDDDEEENARLERAHRKRKAFRKELNGSENRDKNLSKTKESQNVNNDSDSGSEDIPLSKKRRSISTMAVPGSSQSQDNTSSLIKQSLNSSNASSQRPKQVQADLKKLKSKYDKLKSKFKTDLSKDTLPSILSLGKTDFKQLDIAALESKIRPNVGKSKKTETIFSRLKIQTGLNDDKSIIEKVQDFISLPARSKEFARCYLEIFDSLRRNESKAIYINGRSGSGKTSIVKKMLVELEKSSDCKELALFTTVILNRKSVGEDFYRYVWDRLSSDDDIVTSSSAAERSLEFFFTSVDKNRKRHTVIILDDLDVLCNESPNLLCNFFHWTTYPNSKLIVISVGQNPDLIKQTLGKHVLAGINYHNIPFDNYSSEEISNIVQYRLKTLRNNSNFKVYQVKDTKNLVFEKIKDDDNQTSGTDDEYKIVNVYIDDKTIDEACKQICLTNNDAEAALRVVDDASDYVMKEYIAIQTTIMKRNKGLAVTKLPDSQEISLNAILKSLSQTNDIVLIDMVNKLSYIEKLFLFSCLVLARSKKTLILETEDIYEKMTQLVNSNKTNRFVRSILRVLMADYDSIIGEKNLRRDMFEMLNWNKIIMNMVSSQFLVIVKQDDENVNHINSIKMKISLSDLSNGLDFSLIV